jgi:vacuolar-type H+-ATPase subunit I/STV1
MAPMNAQLSLYDALVSVNIPADKARAVVAALEQEMTTVLATKSDIELLRQELHAVRDTLRQELHAVRDSLRLEIASLRQEFASELDSLRQDLQSLRESTKQDMQILQQRLTIRLGLMLFAVASLQTTLLAILIKTG